MNKTGLFEALLLAFMAEVNDALKLDADGAQRLAAVYRAKQRAEKAYATLLLATGKPT